jgi:hypothetical protein
MKVLLTLQALNDDGTNFSKTTQEWDGVDREGFHMIERTVADNLLALGDEKKKK